MTQQNVYNLLKKKDEWMTAKEIGKILKLSNGSVTSSLNRLLKHKEVMKKDNSKRKSNGAGFAPFEWRIGIQ